MFVIDNYSKMIFRKDNEFGTFYQIGLSKKDRNGQYINGYLNVRFKKGVNLENKTKICIKNGFIDFYLDKNNKTVPFIMVLEFETETEKEQETKEKEDIFAQFGQENGTGIDPTDDLPF